jgi:DNA ligase-1
MYAQRGHGKRSGFYSDYTFGVWRGPGELVPVGKAYFGFTDEELPRSTNMSATTPSSVSVRSARCAPGPTRGWSSRWRSRGSARSSRHKSGVAMRFPRINRLRWDKPPGEADRLETLESG